MSNQLHERKICNFCSGRKTQDTFLVSRCLALSYLTLGKIKPHYSTRMKFMEEKTISTNRSVTNWNSDGTYLQGWSSPSRSTLSLVHASPLPPFSPSDHFSTSLQESSIADSSIVVVALSYQPLTRFSVNGLYSKNSTSLLNFSMFLTKIKDRCVWLDEASDFVRFSFITQDSISCLDLQVCENARISRCFSHFLCAGCRSRAFRQFVNTEEKCRKIFYHSRSILYTLHLDLPQGRERGLKDDYRGLLGSQNCRECPLTGIFTSHSQFHINSSCNFIKEALGRDIPKEKILKGVVKVSFYHEPLLRRLDIETASKFIDCFYPVVTDYELFKQFLKQFDFVEWMKEHEQPEILEYLLYHARMLGNIRLNIDDDFISWCIFFNKYKNINPILKYNSDSRPTEDDFVVLREYLSADFYGFDVLQKHIHPAMKSISMQRKYRILEIILIQEYQPYGDMSHYLETAQETLRLIWSSTPDACVTLEELENFFGAVYGDEALRDIHDFYVKAIGELHECHEPRSLKHLSRTAIRRTFEKNGVWIPDGISRLPLPNSLKRFLNLEELRNMKRQQQHQESRPKKMRVESS